MKKFVGGVRSQESVRTKAITLEISTNLFLEFLLTTARELLETRCSLFVANHFIEGNVFFPRAIPRVIAFHALNR